jgi:hypothetical protein
MTTLYDLVGERLALQNKLEELDFDEVTIADTLEGESTAIQAKIEDYAFVIRNMEALPDAIKAEEKRLADRRKAIEKRVEHIKNWLLVNMQQAGISKIESPVFTVALQNNPASVIIDDESLIDDGFKRLPEPLPLVVDKKLIKAAIDAGQVVEGAHIEVKQRLVIK